MAGYYDLEDDTGLMGDLVPLIGEDEGADSPAGGSGGGVTPSPVAPNSPPATAPSPTPPAGPDNMKALLRQYFTQNQGQQNDLADAQGRARENTLMANIGQAGATIGAGLAGTGGAQVTPNTKPFEALQAQAQQPVTDVLQRGQLQNQGNKTLQDYFLRKMATDGLIQRAQIGADSRQKVATQGNETRKEIATGAQTTSKENTDKRVGASDRRTGAMASLGQQRLGQSAQRLDMLMGNQALRVSDKYQKDPIILTTDRQQASLNKGMSILKDVLAGKRPFDQGTKAEIEKEYANVISGGTSSALGQTERVEFNPYISQWNGFLSKLAGYRLDSGIDGYAQQLNDYFGALQNNLNEIRSSRSKRLQTSIAPAISGNAKAQQTLDANVAASQTPGADGAKKAYSPSRNKTRITYPDGRVEMVDGDQR